MTRSPGVHTLVWRGIAVEITYDPDWLGIDQTAHFDIRVVTPEDARLPITETGYRSHFASPAVVAAAGGPVAFVTAWLDAAAEESAWQKLEEASRQLTLF